MLNITEYDQFVCFGKYKIPQFHYRNYGMNSISVENCYYRQIETIEHFQ
jgi:hypothetical protein